MGVVIRRVAPLVLAVSAIAVVGVGCGESAGGGTTVGAGADSRGATTCTGTVAVMAPYGDRAGDDGSLMNWARVSLDQFNATHHTAFRLQPAPVNTNPVAGEAAARRLAADNKVIGMVGPKTSGVALAVGPILDRAGIAWVSPSATRTDLASAGFKGFHRVVADDSIQGPVIARYIAGPLGGGQVVIVHNPEPYSVGLAASITGGLRRLGITPRAQLTAPLAVHDYQSIIARIPRATTVVAIPFLNAGDAQIFVQQLRASGRDPLIIGGDGVFVPTAFTEPGVYVSSYTPDLRTTPIGAKVIQLYRSIFGEFSPFGGPSYVAMEAVLDAAYRTCRDGGTTRAAVARALGKTHLSGRLLGTPVRFLPNGNVANGRFYIYRITGDGYELVQ